MILNRHYTPPIEPLSRTAIDPPAQQYELLLQFDLKREKEKNMILEERLKNKETFILQMKHFQEELTVAYEACKNELIVAQEKIEYLQNVEFREYTEQIADLKHMLMLRNQDSKRNSVGREDKQGVKVARNRSQKHLGFKNNDQRESKTSSYYGTRREKSIQDKFEFEVSKQMKKSANFICHFVQMAECYLSDLKAEFKLTKKLKKSWKWIKEVVKEWDHLCQQSKSIEKFKAQLSDHFNVGIKTGLKDYLQLIRGQKSN